MEHTYKKKGSTTMIDYFDTVLEGLRYMGILIVATIIIALTIATLPLWILPYLIYKGCKK